MPGPLAAFVERMVGASGLYETASEYIRDLTFDLVRLGSHSELGL